MCDSVSRDARGMGREKKKISCDVSLHTQESIEVVMAMASATHAATRRSKNNLFATWALGPVLARNPVMLKEVLRLVLGEDYRETDFSLEQRAVDMILAEIG